MRKSLKANQELVQELNRIAVLKMIRDKGPISRADLAKEIGLSPSTISNLTWSLIKKSLIRESSFGVSRGGRRPLLLQFHKDGGRLVGVEVEADEVSAAVVDLDGKILSLKETSLKGDCSPDKVLGETVSVLKELLEEVQKEERSFYGIGISFPGVVDNATGACLFWATSGWSQVNTKEILEKEINYPILIESDVRTEALGEFWFGAAKNVSNLVCIKVDNGVGSGVILDGHLYRGTNGIAGEIGHIMVDPNGDKCSCGRVGCLETKISALSIMRMVHSGIKQHPDSILVSIPQNELTLQKILSSRIKGDKLGQKIFNQVSTFLGIGVATAVNVYDPEMVILTGSVIEADDRLLESAKAVETRQVLRTVANKVEIRKSSFGDDAGVVGAAALVFQRLISRPKVMGE